MPSHYNVLIQYQEKDSDRVHEYSHNFIKAADGDEALWKAFFLLGWMKGSSRFAEMPIDKIIFTEVTKSDIYIDEDFDKKNPERISLVNEDYWTDTRGKVKKDDKWIGPFGRTFSSEN